MQTKAEQQIGPGAFFLSFFPSIYNFTEARVIDYVLLDRRTFFIELAFPLALFR